MTEEEIVKNLSKILIENRNRNLTDAEKELLKQAIDESRNWQELMAVLIVAGMK